MAKAQKKLSIFYGNDNIEFTRVPRVGDVNRVLIKGYPDCRVVVNAPVAKKDEDVVDAVKKRARWIFCRTFAAPLILEWVYVLPVCFVFMSIAFRG